MLFKEFIIDLFTYDPQNPLLFNSGAFFLLFIVFIAIYAVTHRSRWFVSIFVIAFSLFFYYKSSGWYFSILVLTTVSDYYFAVLIARNRKKWKRRLWLGISIIPSLGLLAYFKYTYLFADTINQLFGTNIEVVDYFALWVNEAINSNFAFDKIFLPVGISFYTFQSVSYVLDVYWRKLKPTKNILDYAFFLCYFPQLVAGPIVKAHHFLPQLKKKIKITENAVWHGFFLILIGLFKKAVIADYISQYNDLVFASPDGYSGFENLMAVYGYALQIYCDFSGYSDMAIGLGKIMGFDLGVNFNFPYQAKNITDFWRRWHISLSTWLKHYLYIPLGGNRKASLFTYIGTILTLWLLLLITGFSWLNFSLYILLVGSFLLGLRYKKTAIHIASLVLIAVFMGILFNENWFAFTFLGLIFVFWLRTLIFPQVQKQNATYANLMITMLIGGLWHGASWKFVFWGALHGIALAIHKFFKPYLDRIADNKIVNFISWAITFHFVIFLWIFFRAGNFEIAMQVINQITYQTDWNFFAPFISARSLWVILISIGFMIHSVSKQKQEKTIQQFINSPYWFKLIVFIITVQLVIQFKSEDVQPFIYFQF